MNNNGNPKDGSKQTASPASNESMIISDRMANPAVVISTLCKRMLSNQEMDDVIRYNLEVILEEIIKIQETIQELRASFMFRNRHDGDLLSE